MTLTISGGTDPALDGTFTLTTAQCGAPIPWGYPSGVSIPTHPALDVRAPMPSPVRGDLSILVTPPTDGTHAVGGQVRVTLDRFNGLMENSIINATSGTVSLSDNGSAGTFDVVIAGAHATGAFRC